MYCAASYRKQNKSWTERRRPDSPSANQKYHRQKSPSTGSQIPEVAARSLDFVCLPFLGIQHCWSSYRSWQFFSLKSITRRSRSNSCFFQKNTRPTSAALSIRAEKTEDSKPSQRWASSSSAEAFIFVAAAHKTKPYHSDPNASAAGYGSFRFLPSTYPSSQGGSDDINAKPQTSPLQRASIK